MPVGGGTVTVADEDVLTWDGTGFTMLFDGSDELGFFTSLLTDLDAFAALGPNQFLVSFDVPVLGPVLGLPLSNGLLIDDADVLLFTATSLGPTTAGTWSLYLDGSDVGLGVANAAEDIDGVAVHPTGRLLISTMGSSSVPGVSFGGEDLVAFTATTTGPATTGTWAKFFDGSDVGLTTAGENVDGIEVGPDIRDIHFSTSGAFGVTAAPEPGEPAVLSGADEDVFTCRPQELPPSTPTECNWASVLFFDGSQFGLGPNDVDAIDTS